jgi:EAL domain-containing protein (putative c-di-GMP-specific phosphodiesterase class I)
MELVRPGDSEGASAPAWYLEGVLSDGKRWIIPLDPLPFSVGRMPESNLHLSAKSVSRNHAELFLRDGRLWIRDLESKNGTYLNRRRILYACAVESGDILHFGTVEFRVLLQEPGSPAEETSTSFQRVADLSNLFKTFEADFLQLLEHEAVVPLFQPIVRLPGNDRFGFEIMGRGVQRGLPSQPSELFGIAAGLGLEAELSRLFWTQGLLAGARLPGAPELFVNLHPSELGSNRLLPSLQEVMERAGRPAVTVEVSEKSVTDRSQMARLRSQLGDLGVKLAYDDFGAGQARFLELAEAPPHYLKFDAALIRDIHHPSNRLQQVVKALLVMAGELGIECIAEGVEQAAEAQACARLGFRFAQGYFFGRPVQTGTTF